MRDEPVLHVSDFRPRLIDQAVLLGVELSDASNQRLQLIDKHGWMIIAVMGDDTAPPFAYSVGLWHRFGLPEVIMFGLPPEVSHSLLNSFGKRAAEGERFGRDHYVYDMIDGGHRLRLDAISTEARREHLRVAGWFNTLFRGPVDYPAVQCLWPDPEGILPGETGFDADLVHLQPRLRCQDAPW